LVKYKKYDNVPKNISIIPGDSLIMQTVLEKPVRTSSSLSVSTRFGIMDINTSNAFLFEHGPLGLPECFQFCLIDFLKNKDDQFKLFQCIDDIRVNFVVIPAAYHNRFIDTADLDEACETLEISPDRLLLLFIVSAQADGASSSGKQFFLNIKAPILINIADHSATQYVFQNPAYDVRHPMA